MINMVMGKSQHGMLTLPVFEHSAHTADRLPDAALKACLHAVRLRGIAIE
jgi:hypothetical protein